MDGKTVTFKVNLQPRSSRDSIDGLHGDSVKIRLTAPPLEGRANTALRKFIARKLKLPSAQVEIISGLRSKHKLLRVTGISKAELKTALGVSLPLP